MAVFFTSDTHFGHSRIIELSKRPFKDVQEMDETMIARWNAKVAPTDLVYHLGDFAVGGDVYGDDALPYLRRLNGKVTLIVGNHDNRALKIADSFNGVHSLLEVRVGNQMIVLCHYAMRVWNKSHKVPGTYSATATVPWGSACRIVLISAWIAGTLLPYLSMRWQQR